jgi:hypothetical protein
MSDAGNLSWWIAKSKHSEARNRSFPPDFPDGIQRVAERDAR